MSKESLLKVIVAASVAAAAGDRRTEDAIEALRREVKAATDEELDEVLGPEGPSLEASAKFGAAVVQMFKLAAQFWRAIR
jgi:hypothetical protein